MKNKKIFIFIICYIAYTCIYIGRLNLSMASPDMISADIMDKAQFGMLGSAFSIIYAFGRLLNGRLSDKKAPWLMISGGLILSSISNIAISFFPPFIGIMIMWSVNAFAQSMLWSSVLCIVSAMYDEEEAKRKTSYMVTSVATGNIFGILVNTAVITKLGLKFAFVIPGALTLISGAFVILFIRSIPSPDKKANSTNISLFGLIKDKNVQTVLIPAVLHGVMKDNISLWMTVYFVDMFKVNLSESAYFVLFIPIIGFIGRTIYPMCYSLSRQNEHKVSQLSFISCVIFSIPLCLSVNSPVVAAICLSVIYASVSLINTSILSIYPIHFASSGNVASVSGIMDFATYFGAGISSVAYGFIVKSFGYAPMFISWIIVSVISVFALKNLARKNSFSN